MAEGQDKLKSLQEGGFSTDELNQWEAQTRKDLSSGGFSNDEVNAYFGAKNPNLEPLKQHFEQTKTEIQTPTPTSETAAPTPQTVVPPQVQADRDQKRYDILQEELKANPNDEALKKEIAFEEKRREPKKEEIKPDGFSLLNFGGDKVSDQSLSDLVTGKKHDPAETFSNWVEKVWGASAKSIKGGYQASVTGLMTRGGLPDIVQPEDAPWYSRIAYQIGMLGGDVPWMVPGAILGGGAGGVAGTAVPVVGNAAGAVIGGGAGALMLPEAMRTLLMQGYEKGDVESFSDFFSRAAALFIQTGKAGILGAATAGAGSAAGKIVGEAAAPILRSAAETTAATATLATVGRALDGEVPRPQDFLDAALIVGGMHGAGAVAGKLRTIYAKTGIKPEQVIQDSQTEPSIKQDLLSSNKDLPDQYQLKTEPVEVTAKAMTPEEEVAFDKANPALGETATAEGGGPNEPKLPEELPRPAESPEPSMAQQAVLDRIATPQEKPSFTWDQLYTNVVNDLHPLFEATKAMGGEDLPVSEHPGKLAQLTRGVFGKADQFLEHGTFDFNTYETTGKGLKEILLPFKDDLDGIRAYAAARRAVELEGRGITTGFPMEQARDVVAEGGKYSETFDQLQTYQRSMTTYLVDSGLLSKDAYDAMLQANQNYVPFFRLMDEPQKGAGKGLTTRNPVKAIKGSERQILDPIESIIKNTYLYMALAERNAVGESFVKLVESSSNGGDFGRKVSGPIAPESAPSEATPDFFHGTRKEFTEFDSKESKDGMVHLTVDQSEAKLMGGPGAKVLGVKVPELSGLKLLDRGNAAQESALLKGYVEAGGIKEWLIENGYDGFKSFDGRAVALVDASKAKILAEKREVSDEDAEGHRSDIESGLVKQPAESASLDAVGRLLQSYGVDTDKPQAFSIFRPGILNPKANEIVVFREGKPEVWEVDKDVAAAFKATDKETAPWLLKMLQLPASALRAGATLTPDFMVKNYSRDQVSAFVFSKNGYIPVLDFLRGFGSIAKKDQDFQNWLKSGGANSAMVAVDRNYIQNNIMKLDRETDLLTRSWNVAKSPLDLLRAASELVENSTRLGEFKRVVGDETGKAAIQSAGFSSREVTLDFARIGAKTQAMNMITAFWNAQVQGVDRAARAFKENPMGTSAKIAAAITMPSLMLWWANHEDPRWKEIPQWEKDIFWIVLTKDHIFRIPKPFELGVIFGSVPERAMDAFADENPNAFKSLSQSIAQAFLPGFIPTAASPVLEQATNHSFFKNAPLVSSRAEKVLPEYQYNDYTSELTKAIGRFVGQIPGMHDSSFASPPVIDNYIRQWTGGTGLYAMQMADAALRRSGVLPDPVTPTATLADIPVVRAFVVRYPSAQAQSIQDFEDRAKQMQAVTDTIKFLAQQGDFESVLKEMKIGENNLMRLNGMKEMLANQNKMIHLVNKNPDIKPDEKRQLIDAIYYQMIETSKAGNKMINEMDKVVKQKQLKEPVTQ